MLSAVEGKEQLVDHKVSVDFCLSLPTVFLDTYMLSAVKGRKQLVLRKTLYNAEST